LHLAHRLVTPAMTSSSSEDDARLEQQLWHAGEQGDQHQMALALDQGANIEWHNASCKANTPLHVARLLLDRGANVMHIPTMARHFI